MSRIRLLQYLACLVLAAGNTGCSDENVSAPCDRTAESGAYFSIRWQDSAGGCVSSSIMFEVQCEPFSPIGISLGLTEDDTLAPYNRSDTENLWYQRTSVVLDRLPPDIIDTGLSDGDRRLYIAADRNTAYVQTPTGNEQWRRIVTGTCV